MRRCSACGRNEYGGVNYSVVSGLHCFGLELSYDRVEDHDVQDRDKSDYV